MWPTVGGIAIPMNAVDSWTPKPDEGEALGPLVRRGLVCCRSGLSELVQRFAHAGLRLLAEPFEGGPEQRGEETGRPFEREFSCVGHLGACIDAAEGHGVDGDDRLVFCAEPDALTGDELAHDVG